MQRATVRVGYVLNFWSYCDCESVRLRVNFTHSNGWVGNMVDFQTTWDQVCRDLPRWSTRVLRPKHHLWTLRSGGESSATAAECELGLLAERFRKALRAFGSVPEMPLDRFRSAGFGLVGGDVAAFYQTEFHYLASPRSDAIHLGLGERVSPACLMSFSPFDLEHLTGMLPDGVRPESVVVLSRQVTVGDVPRNTWTFAFGRACRWFRAHRPDIRMVLTYLDPNLGFEGASYRAANWTLLGKEPKGRYVFVDGIPVPNRELMRLYGTARFDDLQVLLGSRVERTTMPLQPLCVFGFVLQSAIRGRRGAGRSHAVFA